MAFVDELLAMDIYREVHLESSMMVVQKLPKSTTE